MMWSPLQGPEITQTVVSNLLDGAAKNATCYFSMYSIDDQNVLDALLELAKNPSSRFLFDRSQFEGRYEKPKVSAFLAQVPEIQWGVGTSSEGEILHAKIIALLYPDGTAWIFSGSFNLSASAEKEFNLAWFGSDPSQAQEFATQIQTALDWVQAHDARPALG